MKFLSAKSQLTLGLISLQMSVLCGGMIFGLIPDRHGAVVSGRMQLSESLAVFSSQMIASDKQGQLGAVLRNLGERNTDILSIGVRTSDGTLVTQVGEHESQWTLSGLRSTEDQILVPIQAAGQPGQKAQRWGNVELRFTPVSGTGPLSFLLHPWVAMTVVVSAITGLFYYMYIGKMLKHLDPGKAVPQRVRAALDSLAEGLLVLDRQERVVLANQAFATWVGQPPEKLVGADASSFEWANRETETEGLPWQDALTSEETQAGIMLGLKLANGQLRNLQANASPVMGHDGTYGGVLVSFDDVTDLEETRRDLKSAKDEAVEARRNAEKANSAKSEFLARMSHEIRTPMNAILGYTDVLRSGFEQETPDDRNAYLNTIHASGEHLMSLINDILDLSKIESGMMTMDLQNHVPWDLISEVKSVMDIKAQEKGLELTCEAVGLLPEYIKTDAVRFRQALFNLVGNALKFTEKGGVRVVVSMTASQMLQVDVIDTGVGIAEDSLQKVFQQFAQADASISTRFGGTGLGLSISRRLAQMMGGDISVASELGKGSTFTLTVKPNVSSDVRMVRPGDISGSQRVVEEKITLPPCRILVVDDEAANRKLASIYITRSGGEVDFACNGQEALDSVATTNYDAILMDMQMPVMDGMEATRRLRAQGLTMPIFALTANIMQEGQAAAEEAGCSGFLTKPIRRTHLLRSLLEAVQQNAGKTTTPRQVADAAAKPAVVDVAPATQKSVNVGTDVEDMLLAASAAIESTAPQSTASETTPAAAENQSAAPIESTLPTDDPEFQAIVEDFVERLKSRIEGLRPALENERFKFVADEAHWMAGAAGTVGFAVLTDPARKLESAANNQHLNDAQLSLLDIERIVDRITTSTPSAF